MAIAFITLCVLTIPAACIYLLHEAPSVDHDQYELGYRLSTLLTAGCLYWGELSASDQQACRYYKRWK